MPKDDPIEKIRNLIREEIAGSEKARERRDLEAKDPWEKLRGMIRDEVGAAIDALGEGDEGKRKPKGEEEGSEGERPKLGILGL